MVTFSKKNIFFFLLVVTYSLRAITDALFVSRGIDSVLIMAKYATLLLAIVYGFYYLHSRDHRWKYLDLLWRISLVIVTFVLISTVKMVYSGVFSLAVFELAVYMLLPVVTTVIALNLADQDDIYNCLRWILYITFFVYCVYEVGLEMFTEGNLAAISYENSYSTFESHYTSATAMGLCAYFSFDRRKKSVTLLSLVFSLLTFKRVFVVCSIVLFALPLFINVKRRVNIYVHRLCALGICAVVVAYYWFLIPENHMFLEKLLGIESVYDFTSSRSVFFEYIYNNPFFVNFGWGSCEASLGHLLEMDLIQMLLELSIVGLVVFVFTYWRIAGTTIYGMVYMGFHFLNMLTSHSLANAFVWTIVLISLVHIEDSTQYSRRKRCEFVLRG